MGMTTDGPKYKRPTVDGYYGLTNLSHIGVGYRDTYIINLKVLLVRYRDDSEPFFNLVHWCSG